MNPPPLLYCQWTYFGKCSVLAHWLGFTYSLAYSSLAQFEVHLFYLRCCISNQIRSLANPAGQKQ